MLKMLKKTSKQLLIFTALTALYQLQASQSKNERSIAQSAALADAIRDVERAADQTTDPAARQALYEAEERILALLSQINQEATQAGVETKEAAKSGSTAQSIVNRRLQEAAGKVFGRVVDRTAEKISGAADRIVDASVDRVEKSLDEGVSGIEAAFIKRISGDSDRRQVPKGTTILQKPYLRAWDEQKGDFVRVIKEGDNYYYQVDENSSSPRQESFRSNVQEASKKAEQDLQLMAAYRVMGLKPGASIEEIKKQYRVLALQRHPDKGGTEAAFTELNNAYQLLLQAVSNPTKGTASAQSSSSPATAWSMTLMEAYKVMGFKPGVVTRASLEQRRNELLKKAEKKGSKNKAPKEQIVDEKAQVNQAYVTILGSLDPAAKPKGKADYVRMGGEAAGGVADILGAFAN